MAVYMREEAAISTRRENDESVAIIGRGQCGYSGSASKFTGENNP
jgi:hypothetical protein